MSRVALLHLAAAAICLALGVLLVRAPLAVVIAVGLVVLCVLAAGYPVQTLWVSVVASALHGELFFKLRVSAVGVPVSLFDVIPVLILIAALALRARYPRERPQASLLALVFWLSLAGLGLGVLIGLSRGAELYQLGRVMRLEIALLLVLVAAMMVAHIPEWRQALRASFSLAGVLMAAEILISYAWPRVTEESLWAIFGLIDPSEVQGAISSGSDVPLRDIALNPYVMIPAFCFAAVRLLPRDLLVIGLIVSAALLSFSRGAWFAMVAAAITVVAFKLVSRRPRVASVLQAGIPIGIAAVVAISLAGDALSSRFSQTLSRQDASAAFREAETRDVFRHLAQDPATFVFGLGAGTVIEHAGPRFLPRPEPSPLLENNLLSKWTNASALSLTAVIILLFGAFGRGWRLARLHGGPAIGAMGLSLPALALSGLFGGTLNWVPFTGPVWLLAGTIIGSGSSLADEAHDA